MLFTKSALEAHADKAAIETAWDPLKPGFYFLTRATVLDLTATQLQRMQEMRDSKLLVKVLIDLNDAFQGKGLIESVLFVSHRWEDPATPDETGAQLAAIKAHLLAHPEIQFVWFDYSCMPQRSSGLSPDEDDRTPAEKAEFDLMLKAIADLYLTAKVLILLDTMYRTRFWTTMEGWCAMQKVTPQGVRPARAGESRVTVVCIHNATHKDREALLEMSTKTPAEMSKFLASPDVAVTNKKDKTTMLPIVGKTDEHVREMMSGMQIAIPESHEAELREDDNPITLFIDSARERICFCFCFGVNPLENDTQIQEAAQALQDERRFGRVVAMAPVSQYTAVEGKSACTTIACFGALEMLQRLCTFGVGLVAQPGSLTLSPPHLNSAELSDALVRVVKQGVDAHVRALSRNPASQHRSLCEVMDALPATHELRQKLFRGTCSEYLLSGSEDERAACFMQALQSPAAPHMAASYVLTKPPETVLCVIGADTSTPCFLLDSHPNSSRRLAGAHALRFDCVQSLCIALCRRFPVVHLDDVDPGDWQLAYMRQFSAMPLMLTVPLTDNERNSMQCQCMLDGELMVDPVVAVDGHTYEREYILRHFEAEHERIAATHQPAHGDDACCGHVQVRDTINSPKGGQMLLELLIPNQAALSAIQQAVEGGRIGDGEVCDWRQRREAVVRQRAQGGQGGLGGQGEAVLPPTERPRSHLKEGFLIICNRRTDAPRWYMVLFKDRLSWYRNDSKNEPLGQFRFRPHTAVLLTRDQLTLTTPSSDQGDGSHAAEIAEKVVLRTNAHNASVELQEWQDAIREQLRQYAAMSYAPRAEHARILENGLAIGLCTEAELKVGRDTAIRGHCECCGQTAPPPFAPRQCKRCARVLCVACVPHTAFSFKEAVIDNESVAEPQCNQLICMECLEDAANRLRRTVVDESERRRLQLLNEKLQPWEEEQTTLAKAQVKQRLEAEHTLLEEQLDATHAADMAALRTKIAKAEEETRARQLDVERAQIAAQAAEGGGPPPAPAPAPAPPGFPLLKGGGLPHQWLAAIGLQRVPPPPPPPPAPAPAPPPPPPPPAAAARVADVLGDDMDDDLRAKIAFSLEAAAAEEELRQALALSAGERERGRPTLHHVPFQARFRWLRQQGLRLMGRRAPADGGALPRAGGAASVALHPEEDDAMMEAQLAAFRAEEEESVAMQPAPRLPLHGTLQPPVERELAMGLVFPTEFALERLERRTRECQLYRKWI